MRTMFTSRANVPIFYKKEYHKLYFIHMFVEEEIYAYIYTHIPCIYQTIRFDCRIHSYQLNNKLVLLRERHSNYIRTCIRKIFCYKLLSYILYPTTHVLYLMSYNLDRLPISYVFYRRMRNKFLV
uniref:Uncharacterized protein n=1 Tax=Glossina austeni TaxID=7395 RepID=A0A1A9VT84_GLOAU